MSQQANQETNQKFIWGCVTAIILVIVALIMAGVVIAGKIANVGKHIRKELYVEQQYRENWIAPAAGTGGDDLFPAEVDGYVRKGPVDSLDSLPEFNIERAGIKASYDHIEVYAWEVPSNEVAAVFDSVEKTIDDGNYNRRTKQFSNNRYMKFFVSPPKTHGRIYANKGWLFLFLSKTKGDDLHMFEDSYLDAISSHVKA